MIFSAISRCLQRCNRNKTFNMARFAIFRQCWSFKKPHQNCVKLNLIFIIHIYWTAGEIKDPHKNCDGLCNCLHSYVFLQQCGDWCAKCSKNHEAVFRNFAKQEKYITSYIFLKYLLLFSVLFAGKEFLFLSDKGYSFLYSSKFLFICPLPIFHPERTSYCHKESPAVLA